MASAICGRKHTTNTFYMNESSAQSGSSNTPDKITTNMPGRAVDYARNNFVADTPECRAAYYAFIAGFTYCREAYGIPPITTQTTQS
jgi:hypothetical protein